MKEKLRVLEKLINIGYNTDKKIIEMKTDELLLSTNFTRAELVIAVGIKESITKKSLITYISGLEKKNQNK